MNGAMLLECEQLDVVWHNVVATVCCQNGASIMQRVLSDLSVFVAFDWPCNDCMLVYLYFEAL